jgi:hypothetical protein
MKDDMDDRGKVAQKKVLLPVAGPREIEEQGSHFEANNHQQCAKDAVHGQEGFACIVNAGTQRMGFWRAAMRSATSR